MSGGRMVEVRYSVVDIHWEAEEVRIMGFEKRIASHYGAVPLPSEG
jgi:hypothetical protein